MRAIVSELFTPPRVTAANFDAFQGLHVILRLLMNVEDDVTSMITTPASGIEYWWSIKDLCF